MIKFTLVSIVLYLVDFILTKIYLTSRPGAKIRFEIGVFKGVEKVWYVATGWWFLLNVLLIAASAIKLIFMYL